MRSSPPRSSTAPGIGAPTSSASRDASNRDRISSGANADPCLPCRSRSPTDPRARRSLASAWRRSHRSVSRSSGRASVRASRVSSTSVAGTGGSRWSDTAPQLGRRLHDGPRPVDAVPFVGTLRSAGLTARRRRRRPSAAGRPEALRAARGSARGRQRRSLSRTRWNRPVAAPAGRWTTDTRRSRGAPVGRARHPRHPRLEVGAWRAFDAALS